MRELGRNKLTWWAAGAVVVLLAFALWQSRGVEIEGRVALRSWDGAMSIPQPARAMVFSRWSLVSQLRSRAIKLPEQRAATEAVVAEARMAWQKESAAREEALRILRVAERSNAADLAECRGQHEAATQAADAAYADLEAAMRKLEALDNPASLLAEAEDPVDETEVGADGSFLLRARVGHGPVVVVLAGDENSPLQAWMQVVDATTEGRAVLEFSNANLLTAEELGKFLGLRADERSRLPEGAAGGDHDG